MTQKSNEIWSKFIQTRQDSVISRLDIRILGSRKPSPFNMKLMANDEWLQDQF